MRIRMSMSDRLLSVVVHVVLGFILIIVFFPLMHVVAASLSSPAAVAAGKVSIWPVEFSFLGYGAVFKYSIIMVGYRNSLVYTALGTLVNVGMCLIAAFPFALRDLPFRGALLRFFTFTMFFSGGMIPSYILMRDLGLLNTIWAMVIPGALGVYNMIIMRTFIQSNIPNELYEAADMDGCGDFRYLLSIVIPLSKASVAVIALFSAVGHWNAYFNAFLYLSDPNMRPLQIVLRDILIMNSFGQNELLQEGENIIRLGMDQLMKYSLIIVASLPVLIMYPFVQKYFVKGVMIGSIKG